MSKKRKCLALWRLVCRKMVAKEYGPYMVMEYADEAENAEGDEYWLQFKSLQDLRNDIAIWIEASD